MNLSSAAEILQQSKDRQYRNTSRVFAVLLVLQWIGAIVVAAVLSPKTWAGLTSSVHVHLWAAIFLGAAITIFPTVLAITNPTTTLTRHVVAAGQMLMSALLIHLTGGRVETHFHVFGSLAILAFYRDWRVLMTASIIVYLDHVLRGIYWPQSVYGVLSASPWRAIEHAWWVGFEVLFLIIAIRQSVDEMQQVAQRQAQLQSVNTEIEAEVKRQTAELRMVNKHLESFCYSMAHDLKAPLRSIHAFSDLLVNEHSDKWDAETKDLLQRIRNSGNKMNRLVDDLLEYSRVSTAKMALRAVDLSHVFQEATRLLSAGIDEKKARVHLDENLGLVLGHEGTLLQVALNLLNNALKYHKPNTAPDLRVFSSRRNGSIRVCVQDNGVGVASEYQKKIFELFERIPLPGQDSGTGIGLAVVAKSLERLSGDYGVESTPGLGSTFWFELPEITPTSVANDIKVSPNGTPLAGVPPPPRRAIAGLR